MPCDSRKQGRLRQLIPEVRYTKRPCPRHTGAADGAVSLEMFWENGTPCGLREGKTRRRSRRTFGR